MTTNWDESFMAVHKNNDFIYLFLTSYNVIFLYPNCEIQNHEWTYKNFTFT